MEEEIKKFLEENSTVKEILDVSKEELLVIRMYLNLKLAEFELKDDELIFKIIKSCARKNYNYIDRIISFTYGIDKKEISSLNTVEKIENLSLCTNCKFSNCIIKTIMILMLEIDKYVGDNKCHFSYVDVLDYVLDRHVPVFQKEAETDLFEKIDLYDLVNIHIMLENDFVNMNLSDDGKTLKIRYLDLVTKKISESAIDIITDFYKTCKGEKRISFDLENVDEIYNESDEIIRIAKIAGYFKYLIEYKKIDIIKKLREYLSPKNEINGIIVKSYLYMKLYFRKVDELKYCDKTKKQIKSILNYVLNYRYKEETPFVPINIAIYSENRKEVEKIVEIIGKIMWYFNYLPEKTGFYNSYINSIILDKYKVDKMVVVGDELMKGMLTIHNFEKLLYMDCNEQNLIIDMISDQILANNSNICTVVYGDKKQLKKIFDQYPRLTRNIIKYEIELEEFDIEKIQKLVIESLEDYIIIPKNLKERINNYIEETYEQSDVKGFEYVEWLKNQIILNMNRKFEINEKTAIDVKDIPVIIDNKKQLSDIMKEFDSLVGLNEIRNQIKDLVSLLKFNKKLEINLQDFNLHMIFSGNPGTGKTTVARLFKDILFNLGYIKQNKIVEVMAKDLIAEFVGQTAGKTYNVLKSALGGVLFIDEAYSIIPSTEHAGYGEECIATIIKFMEDYKDNLVIVFAGYKDMMKVFKTSNPGLASRIGYDIEFPNYTIKELIEIFNNLLIKYKLEITDKGLEKVRKLIIDSSKAKNFGNARYVNNLFQKILIEHSKNIDKNDCKDNIFLITEDDINSEKFIFEKENKIGF